MMTPEARLYRRWRCGEAALPGTLDDYAAVILAALDLHQVCFDPDLLETAARLAQVMLEEFADPDGGFYTSSAAARDLLFRMKDDYDGAEPSGNSLAVEALVRLARITGDDSLLEPARRALEAFAERLESQPSALPRMLCAWMLFALPVERIVFRGAVEELIREAWRHFLPFTALIWEKRGEPSAEVCYGLTCHAPVHSVEDLRRLLH
jgi:uncharacterized protein YyaL (SSP411 family)